MGQPSACRRCECVALTMPIDFPDATGEGATPKGLDIEFLQLILGTINGDSIHIKNRFIAGPPDKAVAVCFVVVLSPTAEQRLCVERQVNGDQQITFANDGPSRVLNTMEATQGGPVGGDTIIVVKSVVGLRLEATLRFYVETLYDGQRTDVLPNSDSFSFEEVFGK
jgi:hypothetical protein